MTELAQAIEHQWETPDGTSLAGSLHLPGPPRPGGWPAVLLISGSGPLDRNSNMPGQTVDISRALAEHLARLDIASLRFDKRGTGASGGDYALAGFDTEYDDAASALDNLATCDQVDPDRIGVIGHSAGATLAIRLAASNAIVSAAVLLAAASSPGERVLEWQSDQIGRTLPGPDWLTGRLFRAMQRRTRAKLANAEAESSNSAGQPISGRWFREYMTYDPAQDLPGVTCPVLAITGGKDLQVDPAELTIIAELVAGPCRTEAPADLTHVLRTTPEQPTISRYRRLIAKPVDLTLLTTVGEWLTRTLDPEVSSAADATERRRGPDSPGEVTN